MSAHRTTIRSIATLMVVVILLMPAVVHAYSLALPGTETAHAAGGCHAADNHADNHPDQDTTEQSDVRCCELDTPYLPPSVHHLTATAVTGNILRPFNGRQLDGFARKIYKPPRWPFPLFSQSTVPTVLAHQKYN